MTLEQINIPVRVRVKNFKRNGIARVRWQQGGETWHNVYYNSGGMGIITLNQLSYDQ